MYRKNLSYKRFVCLFALGLVGFGLFSMLGCAWRVCGRFPSEKQEQIYMTADLLDTLVVPFEGTNEKPLETVIKELNEIAKKYSNCETWVSFYLDTTGLSYKEATQVRNRTVTLPKIRSVSLGHLVCYVACKGNCKYVVEPFKIRFIPLCVEREAGRE